MDPDTPMGKFWGRSEHLRLTVVHGDVAAAHEFFKLRPDLLTPEFFEDTEYRQGGYILGELNIENYFILPNDMLVSQSFIVD